MPSGGGEGQRGDAWYCLWPAMFCPPAPKSGSPQNGGFADARGMAELNKEGEPVQSAVIIATGPGAEVRLGLLHALSLYP